MISIMHGDKRKHFDREHLLRWITALVLSPIVIYVVGFASRLWLTTLILVASGIGYWELSRIMIPDETRGKPADLFLMLALVVPVFTYLYGLRGLLGAVLLNILACFSAAIYGDKTNAIGLEKLVFRIFNVIYIPYCLSHVILLETPWIFFVLVVIFAADSGAYYTGKKFGRHKLCPGVSPGKTVEGALGGFFASLIVAVVFGIFVHTDKKLLQLVLMGAILNIIGQLGDLCESYIKRSRGVKDSSNILPGHGGLLDRLDSLLFAFPALYYLL